LNDKYLSFACANNLEPNQAGSKIKASNYVD